MSRSCFNLPDSDDQLRNKKCRAHGWWLRQQKTRKAILELLCQGARRYPNDVASVAGLVGPYDFKLVTQYEYVVLQILAVAPGQDPFLTLLSAAQVYNRTRFLPHSILAKLYQGVEATSRHH